MEGSIESLPNTLRKAQAKAPTLDPHNPDLF